MFKKGDIVRDTLTGLDAEILIVEFSWIQIKYLVDGSEDCVAFNEIVKQPEIIWERTLEDSKIPEYKTFDAAGMDFYSPVSGTIPPRGKVVIDLGVIPQIPPGYYLDLEPRSGLSVNFSIENGAGVIDWGYRDPIGLVLYNNSDKPYHFAKGERVCQGVVKEYKRAKNTEGKVDRNINRGGGIGSTGK